MRVPWVPLRHMVHYSAIWYVTYSIFFLLTTSAHPRVRMQHMMQHSRAST